MIVPESYFTITEELEIFGLSCLGGIFMGIIYDVFRLVRITFPHNGILIAAEDILFMGIYVVFLMCFTSAAARGEFRVHYILGNAFGFGIYFFTVGSVTAKALKKLISMIKAVLPFATAPVRGFFVLIYKKAVGKFVGYSKSLPKAKKISRNPLRKICGLLYNNNESNKRKNVTNVAKNKKEKKSKNTEKNKKLVQ